MNIPASEYILGGYGRIANADRGWLLQKVTELLDAYPERRHDVEFIEGYLLGIATVGDILAKSHYL